jgi:hydroxyacid-oxoacid transhydrogenase
MNLYTCYPNAAFLDFVNAPLGKGLPIDKPLKPLIAVPETTGTAIFDLVSKRAKTGIAHRNLKPTLGICDPLNTRTMPSAVHASSGLDVLCHSLESWTAIPYFERIPRPTNPINRPAYQGANPISDIFSLQALRATVKYLPRASKDPEDHEAQRCVSCRFLCSSRGGTQWTDVPKPNASCSHSCRCWVRKCRRAFVPW